MTRRRESPVMEMPQEYVGREATWLKHLVLKHYLEGWAHKLGSTARRRAVRLWYVDCFAGPWRARNQELEDTSIAIGLRALEGAARTWRAQGLSITLGAIFVEKNQQAYSKLCEFLRSRKTVCDPHPIIGRFENAVPEIQRCVGSDAAFIFVDPTGWAGVAMRFIADLAGQRRRDVLVNVMFNDINRFKDDPRPILRRQMQDFFGMDDESLPRRLTEVELIRKYRQQLKEVCRLPFAADLAVPHPTHQRTKLRLVLGGHDRTVLKLFRSVEQRVIGREAPRIRASARERATRERTGQQTLFSAADLAPSEGHGEDAECAERFLHRRLRHAKSLRYEELWPAVLEEYHVTETTVVRIIHSMRRKALIRIPEMKKTERRVRDHYVVQAVTNPTS